MTEPFNFDPRPLAAADLEHERHARPARPRRGSPARRRPRPRPRSGVTFAAWPEPVRTVFVAPEPNADAAHDSACDCSSCQHSWPATTELDTEAQQSTLATFGRWERRGRTVWIHGV